MAPMRCFKSKIDWWIYALVIFTGVCCMLGPVLADSDYWLGLIMGMVFMGFEIFAFMSVSYAISGRELGVRMFYRWQWFPIDRIASVRKVRGILSAPALSADRVAIRFTDHSILKSSLPLEISPKERDAFIDALKEINSNILFE